MQLEQVFERQKAGVAERRLRFGLPERRAALARLEAVIRARQGEICDAIAQDLGRPAGESLLVEVLPLMQEIGQARRQLRRWMRPRRVWGGLAGLGTRARLVPQAKGVALIVAPWNYPVSLALGPLVSALAAGCAAVVKPSELAPASAAMVSRIVAEAFDPDLVAVVEGDRDVATRLLALPFDHIFFTGSPEVGKVVMAAAARTLASVTLELGGKSPCIIGPGADLAAAARWVAFGKRINAGQTCIAPDHLLVHEAVAAPFLAALQAEYARGDSATRIITPRHAGRLRALLAEAEAMGARRITGGPGEGCAMPAVILEGMPEGSALTREEIFGPILPVVTWAGEAALLERLGAADVPLSLYLFERDRARIDRICRAVAAGAVGVNLTLLQFSHAGLPFGGKGRSGQGQAHGAWGFAAFSHLMPVLENRFSPARLLMPPLGAKGRRLLDLLLKWG
ncbi:MAG: aldehyde dehydrogenase family protein [Gemmobacter sp.]|uniref:aldehyde dehydrogenase family protein n=1 Tax=Gemmobacter sp. TaxID=1898957 RepID=UPI001A4E40DB|nr:aldehyde dehydrogenase family protein [Gemmobacter sp.]MBL8563263.1 aldehyde dehydrogenase family protein [Gemmobacter sp.]